ncbi:hypothetical protein AVEN_50338-1 [Araneus ventricosus]|uniref:Uncharacterized protein n=1 Tax=Araneus ventricosus TaxID=182803 RepID=A0A4Y2EAW3_ARAVE|nr:hypothetical protein AVEN_50338-1 [Araneus ventricosus]
MHTAFTQNPPAEGNPAKLRYNSRTRTWILLYEIYHSLLNVRSPYCLFTALWKERMPDNRWCRCPKSLLLGVLSYRQENNPKQGCLK